MKRLKNLKIKNKIILLIVAIGALSSITGNLINLFYEIQRTRKNLIAETQMNAHLIAEYCVLPLEFNYPENAEEVLQKLAVMPNITDGILYKTDYSVFAQYHSTGNLTIQMPRELKSEDHFIRGNYLHVKHPVESKNGIEGYVYLRTTVDWKSIILWQIVISTAITLAMIFLVVVMAFYFQKGITEPIVRLTQQMKKIADSNKFVPALGYSGKDEVGELYRVYNHMIDQIEVRDVNNKKVLEELRASELQYQDLYENAPVMYLSINLETFQIVRCNETLSLKTGYPKNELYGKNIFEIYHPDCFESVQQAINQLKTEEYVANFEFKIIKKDGSFLDISLDATIEKDNSGNTLFSNSVWRDISEQKQAQNAEKEALSETKRLLRLADKSRQVLLSVVEDQKIAKEEIRKLNENLELRVAERTRQLEEANKELESFVYSVSHDLRAPLRSIMGFSQIISRRHKENLNEEGLEYFGYIQEASKNMGDLIEDLLRFSRLAKMPEMREVIDLNEIIESVLQNLNQDIIDNKAKVVVQKNLPKVAGENSLLAQIFSNLIQNAIAYHRKGICPEIHISAETGDNDIVIKVEDNGIGILAEHHEKIFNIFQRLHSGDEYPGTGIGLAIVKKAVNTLGGSINLQSELNKGTIFIVRLSAV